MKRPSRRWGIAATVTTLLIVTPLAFQACLNYQPAFYRARRAVPAAQRQVEARSFVAQSLQLRNDILNEPRWEASFSDEEVNAWLAEDLVTHFADQIPPGVHDPRVAFEPDRVTLAFQLDRGAIRSLIWVVLRVEVPEPNRVALTFEKIRAGMVPISADSLLEPIARHARQRGLDVQWDTVDGLPRVLVGYRPDARRSDVVLERLLILNGQVRLAGRSEKRREIARLVLPGRRALQSTFPNRAIHSAPAPDAGRRNSTMPVSLPPESRSTTRSESQHRAS